MQSRYSLVLCHATDLSALWACRGLQANGGHRVELVTAELLASSLNWQHTVDEGGAHIEITLADGRTIASRCVTGTLNRLSYIPLSAPGASATDLAYAQQEWTAFAVSWLHCLPGTTLNRAHPSALSGAIRHPAEWTLLAVQAGLLIVPPGDSPAGFASLATSLARQVFVVGDEVLGAPAELISGCRQLASLAGCGLVAFKFVQTVAGEWRFCGADLLPDLSAGGAALLEVLSVMLKGKS